MMTCTSGNFSRHVWAVGRLSVTTRQPFLIILCRLPEKGRRASRGDEGEGQRVKRNGDERKETKEIKNIHPPPLPAIRIADLAQM